MKHLLTGICILSFAFAANAQTPKWDSTFRPNSYKSRLEQFRLYPNASTDVIFLGNSITAGVDWSELLQLKDAKNRGISGDISFGILERLDEVTEGKPAKVFILIGINDIARNIPDSVILDNYKRIVAGITSASPSTRIYLQSILPVNNTFPDKNQFNKDDRIANVNAGLKELAKKSNSTFIDIHTPFLDADRKLEKAFTYDGLHLTVQGYAHWAKILKPFIN
jgi:lysophospholipase L1-like esterase